MKTVLKPAAAAAAALIAMGLASAANAGGATTPNAPVGGAGVSAAAIAGARINMSAFEGLLGGAATGEGGAAQAPSIEDLQRLLGIDSNFIFILNMHLG